MLNYGKIEQLRIFQRTAEQAAIHDRFPVIGNADDSGFHHFADFGEGLPFLFASHRADGENERGRRPFCFGNDVGRNGWIIVGRFGVRHRSDSHEASRNRSSPASGDRFRLFGSGLAQMNMDIKKTWSDNQTRCIELRNIRDIGLANGNDFPSPDHHVDDGVDPARGIHHPAVLDQQIHYTPSSR
jgi:hypothetical protein